MIVQEDKFSKKRTIVLTQFSPRKAYVIIAFLFCFLQVCFLQGSLWADTVFLRNGKRLEGVLVRQSRTSIRLNVGNQIINIRKNRIQRIRFGRTRAEQKRSKLLQKRMRQARLQRRRLREKNIKNARIEKAVRNLEGLVREEENRQRRALEKRRRLAAAFSREMNRLASERKRLDDQMRKIKERRRLLEEREQRLREKREREQKLRKKQERERRLREKNERAALGKKAEKKQQKLDRERNPTRGGPDNSQWWRSAVIPGWGFSHRGDKGWGYSYSGLFGASLIYWYGRRRAAIASQTAYTENQFSGLFLINAARGGNATVLGAAALDSANVDTRRAVFRAHSQALTIAGLIYIAQLAHTYWKYPSGPARNTSFRQIKAYHPTWSFFATVDGDPFGSLADSAVAQSIPYSRRYSLRYSLAY